MLPPAESTVVKALAMSTLRRIRRLRDTRLCIKLISFRCPDYQLEVEGIVWLKDFTRESNGIVPRSVELCEASAAVKDVKRPSLFGQQRGCLFPFRSEQQGRLVRPEVA